MNDTQDIASTITQLDEQLHHNIVVHCFGLDPPPEWVFDALRQQVKEVEKYVKDKEYYARNCPLGAFPGTHPRLRGFLRVRNQQKSLPTSECPCESCTEYENFIKAVKLSLPDEMAQKKAIRKINAIAQDIMVKRLAGEEIDVGKGEDKEVREMAVGVIECRIRRTA